MPSGPKKRRASKRKKGANGRFIDPATGEEENHVEVHESVNNEREMSFGDEKAGHAVDEMGLKESQSVDIQMGLKENVKESEDVQVLNKSEYVDRALQQAPLNDTILKNPEENGCGEVVESASQGSPVVMKEGEETSMRGVREERLEEPIGRSLDEAQEMVKTVNQSILASEEGKDLSVWSKTNVEKSLRDDQDSVVDVLPVEDVVERNKSAEVGESEDYVNEVVSVMKEGEEMSIEGVLKDSFKEPTESSSHELAIPTKEIQDSLDESVIEVDVETISFEDAPDSFETPLGSPSMADYMSPIEGDDHLINGYWNQQIQHSLPAKSIPLCKVQDPSLPVESVNVVNVQMSLEDSQHSFKESAGSSSLVDVSYVQEIKECAEVGENACHDDSVMKENGHVSSVDHDLQEMVNHVDSVMMEDEEMSMKDVLEEPQAMVNHVDSVIEMNVDTSLDEHDSSNKLLEIAIQVQDDLIAYESVILAHIETSFKDAQDSLKRSLGDSSIDDVSSMYHGQTQMVNDVESTIKEDEGIPIEGALEEIFKEPNVDTSFKVPLGLISSLDVVFPVEGVVQENECTEVDERACHDPPAMVNHDESEIKEEDGVSMEVVLEEPTGRSLNEPKVVQDSFNDPLESSSLIKSTMKEDEELSIKTVDHSILNVIPSREAQDPSGRDNESVIELNVASTDGQDSYEPQSMVKTVDQSVIEVNLETSFRDSDQDPFKKPMGSSSQVNVSPVEGSGQRNDMVGLVRTLLEEIRRIRAFYEEGLRQTTEIHFRICRVLEKFDSGELI
ncbi:unnamed protein product [Lactuca virosa]|uniref:Uncharacterized protein n=1 Tax=Lactuca virosa TaxID=75947 RepID=A0AAU9M2U6_9ASTR|nr:unnamed protein product [Lactuca virosa]